MSSKLVVKDAFFFMAGRIFSALAGLIVIKIITPYLGPLRFGDYSTILKYFAIWAAFADFGLYVIALKKLGKLKADKKTNNEELETKYSKFVSTRFFMIICVYTTALVLAYLIPSYTSNPYLIRGLPLGMLFSASFMSAGILQIPLQLFRKMENVTLALVSARSIQILIIISIVYLFFTNVQFDGSGFSIFIFSLILLSVVASGIIQTLYTFFKGKKYLKVRPIFDKKFTKDILKENRAYGLAYYLSSFHTLIVLMLLSIIYPTAQNFDYTGIRALALSLIEIFLVVPAALGNSFIHKASGLYPKEKLRKFGNLILLVIWTGSVIFINYCLFSKNIIYFIGGADFLTQNNKIGSDFLLPFLAVILIFSFVKQIFNYLFVATDKQNKLFYINIFGVILGLSIGIPFIFEFKLLGGLIAQFALEGLFVLGALFIAFKNKILPTIDIKKLFIILICVFIPFFLIKQINLSLGYQEISKFFIYAIIFNSIILGISYRPLKSIARDL